MVENDIKSIVSLDLVKNPQSPILTQNVLLGGDLGNIMKTIPIDISMKPSVMEHIQLGQTCSSEEVKAFMTLFK